MSSWSPNFTPFTDLLQSDGAPAPPQDDFSPTHRRSDVGSSPHPRALFPSGAPPTGPYGPYPPPPYAPYPPPPYPYPPPPYAPPTGTGTGTLPPYPPPSYGPYAPPPYGSYAPPPPPYDPYAEPPTNNALSSGSESQNTRTVQPKRPKRLDWTVDDEEKLVHAWLFNSKDSIAGNSKTGVSFWGQITETFNSTAAPSRQRTLKQLKDHWNSYNREVTLFNGYHISEERLRPSGADDAMVMKAAEARYLNDIRSGGKPFKRHHWWEAVRNEQKWKAKHGAGSGSDSTAKRNRLGVSGEYSSGGGEDTEEEERPIGRDRAKAAARRGTGKGKAKETSSSSSEVASKAFAMKNMWSGLVKAKLLKQWNKMKDRSTTDMDESEKRKHAKAMNMVEKELGLNDDENEED